MRIATLNLGHQVIKPPRHVAVDLLDALVELDADLLCLTEFVQNDACLAALRARWPHMLTTEQVQYGASRHRFANQVAALSRWPMSRKPGLAPVPDVHATTSFLSVEVEGLVATGLRAPAYVPSADWYAYWEGLRARLDGDVVIGDLNVDPSRGKKRDRVLPEGWRVITPPGVSYRSPKNGTESAIDHALVRPEVGVVSAGYRPHFFERHSLDHRPLVIEAI